MYSYTAMAGYSDCSPTEELKIPSVVNFLQNCSMFHSASIGFDLKHYQEMKKAWLLSSWQIEIEDLPTFGESFRVCTKPYDFKGFYGMRNFWIEDMQGKMLVKANSIWFFMDLEKGLPVKVTEEEAEGYGKEEPLLMEYEDRRIRIPKEAVFEKAGEPVKVTEALLDTNRHVNNGQYIRIAYEFLQACGEEYNVIGNRIENAGFYPKVRQIRAEYIKSAKYEDVMQAFIYRADNLSYIKLADEEEKAYAVITFKCE